MTQKENKIEKGNNTLADLTAEQHAVSLEEVTGKLKYLLDRAYNESANVDITDAVMCMFKFNEVRQLVDIANDYVNVALDCLEQLQAVLKTHTLKDRA